MVNKHLPPLPLPLDMRRRQTHDDSLPTPPFSNLSAPLPPRSSSRRPYATTHANSSSHTVLQTPPHESPSPSTSTIPSPAHMASPADKRRHRWLRRPSTDTVSSGSSERRVEDRVDVPGHDEPRKRIWQSTPQPNRTPPADGKTKSRVDLGTPSPVLARKPSSGALLFASLSRGSRRHSESPAELDDAAHGGLWGTPKKARDKAASKEDSTAGRERAERDKAFKTLGRGRRLVPIVPRDDAGDAGVSRPFTVNHELHVSPDLANLPTSWLDALKAQGLTEADLLLIAAARRAQHDSPLKVLRTDDLASTLTLPETAPRRSISLAELRSGGEASSPMSPGPAASPVPREEPTTPTPVPATPRTPRSRISLMMPKLPKSPKAPRTPLTPRTSSMARPPLGATTDGRRRLSADLKGFKDLQFVSEDDEWAAGIIGAWANEGSEADGPVEDEPVNVPPLETTRATPARAPPPPMLHLGTPTPARPTLTVSALDPLAAGLQSPSSSSCFTPSGPPSPALPIPVPPSPRQPIPVPPSPAGSASSLSDDTDGVSRVFSGPRSTYADSDAEWTYQSLPPPPPLLPRQPLRGEGAPAAPARLPRLPLRKSSDSFGVHYSAAVVRPKLSGSFASADDDDLVTPHETLADEGGDGGLSDDGEGDADDELDAATQCSAARHSVTSSVFSSLFKHPPALARSVADVPPLPPFPAVPRSHPMASSLEALALASAASTPSLPPPTPPRAALPLHPAGPRHMSRRSAAHLSLPASAHSHSLPATRPSTPDDFSPAGAGFPAAPAWSPAMPLPLPLGPVGSAERDALLTAIERAGADERASIALSMLSSESSIQSVHEATVHRAVARMLRVKEDDDEVGGALDALERAAEMMARGG